MKKLVIAKRIKFSIIVNGGCPCTRMSCGVCYKLIGEFRYANWGY